jgi:alpha-ketoglutarate-dependent taurine dioxygenase
MNHVHYDRVLPDADTVAGDLGAHGVVAITNSGVTPEAFAEWSLDLGYHLSPDIWCTDHEHSDLFWRVTNGKVDDHNQGLFGDYELDWHTNVTPIADAEEIVGLYAKTITYDTSTWFCNTIPYWNTLSSTNQELYQSLTVVLDPTRKLGKIQSTWEPNFEEIYNEQVFEDIKRNRNSRNIFNTRNIEEDNKHLYKPSRGVMEDHKLVPNHPSGTNGLFFSPYEVHGFKQNDVLLEPKQSAEIYWQLWNDLYITDKYMYKHTWRQGDICLMDQVLTIHKRPTILQDKPRELLRLACWYKTARRKHTDYVI